MLTDLAKNSVFRQVSKRVGQAIGEYDMLRDGDRVIVAVSGGKDSLTLLEMLKYRQTFAPIKYELMAVFVEAGMPDFPLEELVRHFEARQVKYHVERIDFLEGRKWEEINCFWCSWNRRKALFRIAEQQGFNKIALGHHQDDIVETILLNLFFRGEISAMCPRQDLFDGKVSIIRPLALEREALIRTLVRECGLQPLGGYQCPNNDISRRTMIKKVLAQMEQENPDIITNIFRGLHNIKPDYLLGQGDGV